MREYRIGRLKGRFVVTWIEPDGNGARIAAHHRHRTFRACSRHMEEVMRYIWQPGSGSVMHIQATSPAGATYNGSLCGRGFHDGYRTINPPFGLGRKTCKHCKSALAGRRKLPDWLAARPGSSPAADGGDVT